MMPYDMVVVDEFSLLSKEHFERLLKMWRAAEKLPTLIFVGDRFQLPGMGDSRPWHSQAFRKECKSITLRMLHRCKDVAFARILDVLRRSIPKKSFLRHLRSGHSAWDSGAPTAADLRELYADHPDTSILTFTKKGERVVNDIAVQAIFGNRKPLTTLPGDVEQNMDNFDQQGKLRSDRVPLPSEVPIYKNMKLVLTQNVRKSDDYVNGMDCVVEKFVDNAYGGVLFVRTATNQRIPVTRWTDIEKGRVSYFPIRIGYGSTVHKAQGGEYSHITVWPDTGHMPAAGYTALSRVATAKDYLLGGKLKKVHFVPATYTHPASFAG
jgi:ATP-dependent exoDNAse (exonuclease V) alpha subunit